MEEGTRPEDIAAAKANVDLASGKVEEAKAAIAQAEVALERAAARSPFDGVVVRQWRKRGEMVVAGTPVITVFDPATLHVAANIEEKDIRKIDLNDEVNITIDAYPDIRLKGRVQNILRATNSQFSLIPAEGVSGAYIKVAQRIPIRITLEDPPDLFLGPGLSVEISIHKNSAKPVWRGIKRP
jgi:multidrug resistance efflux pump